MPRLPESDEWIKRLDLNDLRSKFSEAADIFESSIYFDGLLAGVGSSNLYRTKFGTVSYLESPRKSGSLHVAGTQQSDIVTIQAFYAALGVLKSPTVGRVFAPDEALFRPYFSWVSGVLPHIIQDAQISRVFAQALDYYEKDDYQHCISTLGLIAEDYLQRIYVNLLREQISGGLTLGQTVDRLHKRIDDLYPPTRVALKGLETAYEQIKTIESSTTQEGLKPILREIVLLIQEDRTYYGRRIDEIIKPAVRRTPFPARIGESLNELLKWRNAASHNSRVPLGAHEADRTLFCLVSIIAWWQEQLATLDWSTSKLEVMEVLLAASKPAAQK